MKVTCERFGCSKQIEKIVPWKKYCSNTCKQIAWAIRIVQKESKKNKKFLILPIVFLFFSSYAFASTPEFFNQVTDAIYKAEGGSNATKPFGILSVPCSDYSDCRKIAYRTVKNNYDRWLNSDKRLTYLEFLAKRYCPVGAANDPQGLNRHWLKNVMFFMNQKEK